MGRSIPVKIGQKEFKSKKAALSHFMDQCGAVKESGPIREGDLFEDLRELYTRYCELTKWELGNRQIYAFSVDYDPVIPTRTMAHICATGSSFHQRIDCPFRSEKRWMRSPKLLQLNNGN